MTNINKWAIPKNIQKPVETVYEIKNEYKVPSFEEFMKSYEGPVNYDDLNVVDIGSGKGYGPCRNTLCGCSCSSNTCTCPGASMSIGEWGLGASASGRAKLESSYLWAKGQASHQLFSTRDSKSETRFLSTSIGGEIEANPATITDLKLKLGVNLVEHKSNGFEVRAGVNVDTGGSVNSDGVEAKFLGFGLSLGKKNGISTPLGGFSVDNDDCVVQ